MNRTITINSKTIEEILARLDSLSREINTIKTKIISKKHLYGSDMWWEKEIEEGLDEIKQGKYTIYKDAESLIDDLRKGA